MWYDSAAQTFFRREPPFLLSIFNQITLFGYSTYLKFNNLETILFEISIYLHHTFQKSYFLKFNKKNLSDGKCIFNSLLYEKWGRECLANHIAVFVHIIDHFHTSDKYNIIISQITIYALHLEAAFRISNIYTAITPLWV